MATEVATPWSIATSSDLSFPTTPGNQTRVQAWLCAWTDVLGRMAIHGNGRANDSMARVYNLMGSPALLFHPALAADAVRTRLIGSGPGTQRPVVLDELAVAPAGSGQLTTDA